MSEHGSDDEEGRLLDEFNGKLSGQRPKSKRHLWVLWSPTDQSSSSVAPASINSVDIKDKIRSALHHMDLRCQFFSSMIVQFWGPVMNDGRCFLTTSEQPFGISGYNTDTCLYRKYSEEYKFNVEDDLGFPARVFRQKLPESTPDFRYYSTKDHPWWDRLSPTFMYYLFALPVFERTSGHCCIGVLELVTSPVFFSRSIRQVCIALEAEDLKCRYVGQCDHFDNKEVRSEDLQHALDEIIKVLEVVCKTHKLPLALTWVPCRQCSDVAYSSIPEKSCTSFDVNSAREVMSTIHDASYGTCLWTGVFVGLHLQKGQGVAGRAYLSHNSCFCNDVTQFSLSDYPLAHYARKYGLAGSFAICLRSSYTGEDDYILEFFLPGNVTNEYPRKLLDSILGTMKQHLSSFKLASGEELGVELSVEAITTVKKFESFQICQTTRCSPMPEALQNGGEMVQADSSDEQLMVEDDNGRNTVTVSANAVTNNSGKEGTLRTLKKTIPLEDIEQHFGKNLEDVAELFDISRSTFKRICRDHGIMRWRKHKRNKVNGPLSMRGPPCSNLPPEQAVATVDHPTPHVTAMQNVGTVTIKAKYGENNIKFRLSSSAGKEDLEQEITKRLKLKVGSFNIHYLDEDDDWYLVTCGDVLQDCMSDSATTIRMKVQPVTN